MLHFLCDMRHEFFLCRCVSLHVIITLQFVHLNIVTSYLSHSKPKYLFIFVPHCAHFIKKISILILQFFFFSFVVPSTLMSAIKKCICEISQHLCSTYGMYSKKSEKSFFHSKNIKAPVIFFSIHVYVQYITYTHTHTHTSALLKRDHLVDHSVEVEGGRKEEE